MKPTIIFLFLLNLSSFSYLKEDLSHLCKPVVVEQCSDEILLCPAGYIDGCLSGETDQHQCVLKEEGPLCEVPMNLHCPKNFQDGCLVNQTDTHECVPKKGPSCAEESKFTCPIGFQDACE